MPDPWLIADNVRLDDRGTVVAESIAFTSEGPHLAVIGGPSILGRALCGTAAIVRGSLRLRGKSPHAALLAGEVACAALDPCFPEGWSPRTLAVWSARLAGASRVRAKASAEQALVKLQLQAFANRPLPSLPLAARRAATLAAALSTGASTIVVDDPFVGLPDDASRTLGRVASAALDDVAWIYLTGHLSIASAFGVRADDALVMGPGGGVVAQGAPAEIAAKERLYALRVAGPAQALAARARERGATVEAKDRELRVELADNMTTTDLFSLAAEASVTIISLRPVGAALS